MNSLQEIVAVLTGTKVNSHSLSILIQRCGQTVRTLANPACYKKKQGEKTQE